MNKFLVPICYFLTLLAIHAEQVKKSTNNPVTQTDVYIWGFIFLALSIGSLLLIVNIFPKTDAYKKQQEMFRKKLMESKKGAAVSGTSTEAAQKVSHDPETAPTEIEKKQSENLTTAAAATAAPQPTHTSVKAPDTKPTIPPVKEEIPKEQTTPPPSQECVLYNYNKVFEAKSPSLENSCKEFMTKLSSISKVKTIIIYFVRSDKFNGYLEKRGEVFTKFDAEMKIDITDDIVKFLKNKLGAFSSNHADAVLPLVHNNNLFGAVKLEFLEPISNPDINPIWSEVKSFARYFDQMLNYNVNVQDNETSLYTLEHFNNILNYRVTLDIKQNLSVIKILNTSDKMKTFKEIPESLNELFGKKPEVYKLSEDMVGIFLGYEDRDKLSKSVEELKGKLGKKIEKIDISVGSADYQADIKFAHKWYDRALTALNAANQAGKNQFKLFQDTPKS